jgi:hypothetical protein
LYSASPKADYIQALTATGAKNDIQLFRLFMGEEYDKYLYSKIRKNEQTKARKEL